MPKASKPAFYAVAKGRVPGVYSTWYVRSVLVQTSRLTQTLLRDECQQQVSGFTGNKHQKFPTLEQAKAYLAQHGVASGNFSASASSSTTPAPPSSRKAHGPKPYERPTPANEKAQEKGRSSNSRWAALSTEVIQDESGWDVVYSDGACKGNGKIGSIAGVGVWWGRDDPRYACVDTHVLLPPTRNRNIAERCPGVQTNNRAELIVRTPVYPLLVLC